MNNSTGFWAAGHRCLMRVFRVYHSYTRKLLGSHEGNDKKEIYVQVKVYTELLLPTRLYCVARRSSKKSLDDQRERSHMKPGEREGRKKKVKKRDTTAQQIWSRSERYRRTSWHCRWMRWKEEPLVACFIEGSTRGKRPAAGTDNSIIQAGSDGHHRLILSSISTRVFKPKDEHRRVGSTCQKEGSTDGNRGRHAVQSAQVKYNIQQ